MKNNFTYILILFVVISCSNDNKTDSYLLEKDKKTLIENLNSDKVSTYKFCKILIRASIEKDTVSKEFMLFKSDLDNIFNKIKKYENTENLSLLDYISIYNDYKKVEKFIMKTDEDIFPTLTEAINEIYGDSIGKQTPRLKGDKKTEVEAFEHAILSAIVLLSKDLGKEVTLYECSKTKPEFIPDSEFKTLIQYFRGFVFFEKGLYYLSEDEISRNIAWLDNNKDIDLPLTRAIFKWGNLDNDKTHIGFHSLNFLFRGFDRLMMNREIDEKRALEDFGIFLSDCKKLGLDNELIWAVEIFLYLKNEESEKAISSLNKLKTSKFVTESDIKNIDESIKYLKKRKPGKVLNGFYDNYFLSKIASKYVLEILSKIDWKKVLKENNVSHTEEIFRTIDNILNLSANIDKHLSGESLKETGNALKEKGKNLFNQAKDAINEK